MSISMPLWLYWLVLALAFSCGYCSRAGGAFKAIWDGLACLWYGVRPLVPRHRSREAFVAYMRSRGLDGEGNPL